MTSTELQRPADRSDLRDGLRRLRPVDGQGAEDDRHGGGNDNGRSHGDDDGGGA